MVAFWGTVPPLALGIIMYKLGQKQGDRRVQDTKEEIRRYIKEELIVDIKAAITSSAQNITLDDVKSVIYGALGIVGKGASDEAQKMAQEYIQQNPQAAGFIAQTSLKSAARSLAKKAGIPKPVAEGIMALMTSRGQAGGSAQPKAQGPVIQQPQGNYR